MVTPMVRIHSQVGTFMRSGRPSGSRRTGRWPEVSPAPSGGPAPRDARAQARESVMTRKPRGDTPLRGPPSLPDARGQPKSGTATDGARRADGDVRHRTGRQSTGTSGRRRPPVSAPHWPADRPLSGEYQAARGPAPGLPLTGEADGHLALQNLRRLTGHVRRRCPGCTAGPPARTPRHRPGPRRR